MYSRDQDVLQIYNIFINKKNIYALVIKFVFLLQIIKFLDFSHDKCAVKFINSVIPYFRK
jgi:hypothetical protein